MTNHNDMVEHRKYLNDKYEKEGNPNMIQSFLELTNGHDQVLIMTNIDKTTIDVFLNGEYVADLGLYLSTSKKMNEIRLFAGHIQRIRDMEYAPIKGYFTLTNLDGDRMSKPVGKPYNPLGLNDKNLHVFTDMLNLGFNYMATRSNLMQDTEKIDTAKRLLKWLAIDLS